MNRSGDAACRRSCLQQPETLVRGLGPHRQDRLKDPASNHLCHSYSVFSRCGEGLATGGHDAGGGGEVGRRTVRRRRQRRARRWGGAVSAAVAEDGRRLRTGVGDRR